MNKYLSVSPEIEKALAEGRPVVALESTILSHGMPYPENVEFSHKVEEIVRGEGAVPATTAIIGGKLKVGLTAEELQIMCVLYTEDVGGVLMLVFDEEGNLELKVDHREEDFTFDEIGSVLKIKELQKTKRELFESLELFFKIFYLGEEFEEEKDASDD